MADDPQRALPPSAPPPGWDRPLPDWATGAPEGADRTGQPGGATTTPPPAGKRGKALLGDRRVLAGGAAAVLLVVALVGFLVLRGGGDGSGSGGSGESAGGGGGGGTAAGSSKPLRGTDLSLLDGRLIVAAQQGWEQLETSTDSATVRVQLQEASGRELLATMVTAALPGAGSVDSVLAAGGATRFEAKANGALLQAAAVPDRGQVVAATPRPWGIFYLSLSVFALDNQGLDLPTLQKLFNEQVAPTLRFP